ncbi:MAG: hypothetical protein K2M62_08160 [Muribaculaceae bacterium]|nr:hypothetical protein [Muribaculaceae bacterium]
MLRFIALSIYLLCLGGIMYARDYIIEITGEDACPAQFTVAPDLRLDFEDDEIVVWDKYGSFRIPLLTVDRINYIPVAEETPEEIEEVPDAKEEMEEIEEIPDNNEETPDSNEEIEPEEEQSAAITEISVDMPRVCLESGVVRLEGNAAPGYAYQLFDMGGTIIAEGRLTTSDPLYLSEFRSGTYALAIERLTTLKILIK